MAEELIQQLNSADPEQRKAAIKALAKRKERAALRHLAALYKSDPDDEVRELALKAGRYIKKSIEGEGESPSPRPTAASYLSDEAAEETPVKLRPLKSASAREAEQAKSWLDQAQDQHWHGNDDKAVRLLAKALQTDPRLWDDTFAIGLIESITGLPAAEAFDFLMDGATATAKTKRKEKPASGLPREATWGDALIDLGIYGAVTGGVMLVGGLLGWQAIIDALETSADSGELALTPAERAELLDFLLTTAKPLLAIFTVIYALFQVAALLIQDTAIHLAATMVLGGEGSLAGLIRKTTLFFTVTYIILTVLSFASSWPGLAGPGLAGALSLLSLVGTVAVLVWTGHLVGEAYQFSLGKGCSAILIGSVILIAFFACTLCALLGGLPG